MAQLHFNDEILMAFADGELDEQVAASVEKAMSSDLDVARRIAEFLRSRHLVRSAFPSASASDVPSELLAAVQAQIDRFEGHAAQPETPGKVQKLQTPRHALGLDMLPLGWALAASLAAIAVATGGYLVGQRGAEPSLSGPIAQLAAPEVRRALSETPSGQDRDLPFGRMRVISTFRMADGSLCREFKLEAASGSSEAVACRDRDWTVRFAVASGATNDSYVPSDGADLMAGYLQDVGAGAPLVGAEEIEALSGARRRK